MMVLYILAFCRFALGLAFLYAFVGKIRDIDRFRQAISDFRLLSPGLSQWAALLFLAGELAIVVCMLLGGYFLLPGFLLAVLLLCVFSAALAVVLVRKQRTSCNCFGPGSKPVTPVDLYRNAGLLLCAATGCGMQTWSPQSLQALSGLEWLLVAVGATIFVLLWTQLSELVQLFH